MISLKLIAVDINYTSKFATPALRRKGVRMLVCYFVYERKNMVLILDFYNKSVKGE